MAVKIRIPTPLRRLTGGKEMVEVEGNTLKEVLENLEKNYPGFRERLFDDNGDLRRFVNIFVNDEDVRFLKGVDTELKDGDEVSIIPAIAGGKGKEPSVKKKKKAETKRLYLTYPSELIKEPVIYYLGHKFKVVTNIRSASVKDDIGLVALEMSGDKNEIDKAIRWLERKGIKVEPIEQDVVEG